MAAHAVARLPGDRLHLQHGPIDLVIGADGAPAAVAAAYRAAEDRFAPMLGELVAELPALRTDVSRLAAPFAGAVAQRMLAACRPHAAQFITPMAAVAGAVADEILAAMLAAAPLARAYVNNGGDIALHLTGGAHFDVGLAHAGGRPDRVGLDGALRVTAAMPVRGVATSGWRGRSFSLGIADSVTVLAGDAAAADAAATMIGNAVDAVDPAIERRPADTLTDDTDLGTLPVTVSVGPLAQATVAAALDAGARHAEALAARGLIHGCLIGLQGRFRAIGAGASSLPAAIAL